jgi:hypothetical protein
MTRALTLVELLQGMEDELKRPLNILETGCIRDIRPEFVMGDGYSTQFIAEWVKNSKYNHWFTSVDLDISVCAEYLKRIGMLEGVNLVQADSVQHIQSLYRKEDVEPIDFLYLDTADSAEHILAELMNALDLLLSDTSIVVVDDFSAHKCDLVLPFAQDAGCQVDIRGEHVIIRGLGCRSRR